MRLYLTRDYNSNVYVDVWLKQPQRFKSHKGASVLGRIWIGDNYVGESKAHVVENMFGTVPSNDFDCISVECDAQQLKELSHV